MSAFGFDPEQLFRPRRPRPRSVRPNFRGHRRRWITLGVIAAIIVLVILARWLLGLRATYLYYSSLGHTNVFWTPFIAQLVLFFIGLVITGGVVGASVVGWTLAARTLDRLAGRIALWAGIAVALVAGIAGGAFLASNWQQVLLWMHGQQFGATDPVFNTDYSFFIFTLPVIDAFSALLWGGVIVGLLGALACGFIAVLAEQAPSDIPLPLHPPEGRTPGDALRIAVRHVGFALAAIFLLAAAGAHFGVYHLATSSHDNFVGLDATQRNVVRPVLGALQVIALLLAIGAAVLVVLRWRTAALGTAILFGGGLAAWLIGAGLAQGVPAAIYQATSVNPNAQQAQAPAMTDFLNVSRYAWDLEDTGSNSEVQARSFGTPHAPTLQDLLADIGTLRNVRIQDTAQLPDTLAQVDRSRSYQTYPTITVDRYADPSNGGDTEVMIGPREIAEGDVPNPSFVNSALNYTHGYGVTAVSVNAVASEGKPQVLVGQQPMQQVSPSAPPDLDFNGNTNADPSIYCGLDTTQAVVTGTQQPEFNYPSGSGDNTTHAGADEQGI
ncbi:MAG: UPF0182 family protein, partial [Candidatus Dormibacteraeota bacterium]|nr:UPF0182 family protein [Candidatus Dormibacteraeota bacterium]